MKKILEFLNKNKYFLATLIIIYYIFNIRLPYYIDAPGGLININDRYIIENEYKVKGSINMTYVSEYKATLSSFILAKLDKNLDIYKEKTIIPKGETEKDSNYRGEIMLKEASDNAIIVAYKKANKECIINNQSMVITYIDESAITNLKIGDEIISINGVEVSTKDEASKILSKYNVNDKVELKVKSNNKIKNKYAYLKKRKIIGVLISYKRELNTNPKIKINYKKNEYGPSGGLMTTLAIYNKLTKEDITKGQIISGTGTIDEEGNVGEIDGVKYKLKGAIKNKASIFLVPSGNYDEAIKLKKQNNYNIKIVEIHNIDDALNYLKK